MNAEISDEEVIAHFKQNKDQESFNKIVLKYKDRLFNFILRYLSNTQDAEDVLQDIFIKVYFKINLYDERKSSFVTWVFTVTRNTVFNKLKQKKMVRLDYDNMSLESNQGNNFEDDEIVQKAINVLDNKYKDIVLLYYMEGFKYKEIADILKMPINTVKTRLNRAKGILKNELKNNF